MRIGANLKNKMTRSRPQTAQPVATPDGNKAAIPRALSGIDVDS